MSMFQQVTIVDGGPSVHSQYDQLKNVLWK